MYACDACMTYCTPEKLVGYSGYKHSMFIKVMKITPNIKTAIYDFSKKKLR